MVYNKPPLTYIDHVKLWQARGLEVDDETKAAHYFESISYYRLSVYALQFQSVKDTFNPGTHFQDVLNLYRFDRELRQLVFGAIEQIEVALRSRIVHILAHKYGSHWQDDPALFKKDVYTDSFGKIKTNDYYTDIQEIISSQSNAKYPEVFVSHYKTTYSSPINPPSWMIIELLTAGQLSRLYSGLANKQDKKDISNAFDLNFTVFGNWLHALVYCRNLCAHHSRFWNRDFVIQPVIPKSTLPLPWITTAITNNRRCFYILSIIKYFLQSINPNSGFKDKLIALMDIYPSTPIKYMGIDTDGAGELLDWQNEPIWS